MRQHQNISFCEVKRLTTHDEHKNNNNNNRMRTVSKADIITDNKVSDESAWAKDKYQNGNSSAKNNSRKLTTILFGKRTHTHILNTHDVRINVKFQFKLTHTHSYHTRGHDFMAQFRL